MKFFVAFVLVAVCAMAYGLPSAKEVNPENIELSDERSPIFPIEEEEARDKRGINYQTPYAYYQYPAHQQYNAPYTYTHRRYPYHYNSQYYG